MSATDLNRKAHISEEYFEPFWVSKENDLTHCNPTVTRWRALRASF